MGFATTTTHPTRISSNVGLSARHCCSKCKMDGFAPTITHPTCISSNGTHHCCSKCKTDEFAPTSTHPTCILSNGAHHCCSKCKTDEFCTDHHPSHSHFRQRWAFAPTVSSTTTYHPHISTTHTCHITLHNPTPLQHDRLHPQHHVISVSTHREFPCN